MPDSLLIGLLWFAAIGCGVIGGLYFTFSTFVMSALARIDRASGVAAMNAINVVIVRSAFLPVFLGTTVAALALALVGLFHLDAAGAPAMIAGGAAYVVGMFVVTMLFNVPLNNALARDGEAAWDRYLRVWTAWNHVRALASIAAAVLFVVAIAAR
jgi:uncharacterized membrane protein